METPSPINFFMSSRAGILGRKFLPIFIKAYSYYQSNPHTYKYMYPLLHAAEHKEAYKRDVLLKSYEYAMLHACNRCAYLSLHLA